MGSTLGGFIGPKTWCVLYTSAVYTRVYMVVTIAYMHQNIAQILSIYQLASLE